MGADAVDLSTVLRAACLPETLLNVLDEEELTVDLLRSMSTRNLLSSLAELGLSAGEASRLADVLTAPPAPRVAPPAPVPSSSEPPPMVICADHGLCNRLRAVLSYREVAQRQGRKLVVVWQRDMQCNGEFLDCFAPLPGVRFVREPPSWAPAPDRVNHCHHEIGTAAEAAGYALLQPSPTLRALIDARVHECVPFAAVHVRRTDMTVWAATQPNGRYAAETTDAAFDAFLEAHPQHRVYVATDCGATSARFAQRYARRLAACAPSTSYQQHKHRQTSLIDAVVDLFCCAAAEHFMGSYGSSFSDAIVHVRAARGNGGKDDRHAIEPQEDWAGRQWSLPGLRELRSSPGAA